MQNNDCYEELRNCYEELRNVRADVAQIVAFMNEIQLQQREARLELIRFQKERINLAVLAFIFVGLDMLFLFEVC